jgi:hypothetical protein
MSQEYYETVFAAGAMPPQTEQPDNKTSFALTQPELAFAAGLQMQINDLKSFVHSILSVVEKQSKMLSETQETMKHDFLRHLAQKHGVHVPDKKQNFNLDLANGLFVVSDKQSE